MIRSCTQRRARLGRYRAPVSAPLDTETLEVRRMLAVTFDVDTTRDAIETDPGDVESKGTGKTTLRAALMEANATDGRDTIRLGEGTFTLTIGGRKESKAARSRSSIARFSTTTPDAAAAAEAEPIQVSVVSAAVFTTTKAQRPSPDRRLPETAAAMGASTAIATTATDD